MLFICSGEFIISLIPEGDLIKMHVAFTSLFIKQLCDTFDAIDWLFPKISFRARLL